VRNCVYHQIPNAFNTPNMPVAAVVTEPGNLWVFWTTTYGQESGQIFGEFYDCPTTTCSANGGSWSGARATGGYNYSFGPLTAASHLSGYAWIVSQNGSVISGQEAYKNGGGPIFLAQSPIYGPGTPGGGSSPMIGQPVLLVPDGNTGMGIYWTATDYTIQASSGSLFGWAAGAGAIVRSNVNELTSLTGTSTTTNEVTVLYQLSTYGSGGQVWQAFSFNVSGGPTTYSVDTSPSPGGFRCPVP